MIVAECNYTQFTNLKALFGAKFAVVTQDATADGGYFTALASDGGSIVMRFVGAVKPATFTIDFPTAVAVDSASIS